MSMSKDECLHDCTCCAVYQGWPSLDPDTEPVDVRCDLPGGHARSVEGEHWDPVFGWWDAP